MYEVSVAGKKVAFFGLRNSSMLNTVLESMFQVDNTKTMRSLLTSGAIVLVKYTGQTILDGKLDELKYFGDKIQTWARDKIIGLEDLIYSKDQGQDDIRRVIWRNTSCDTILDDVLSGTGFSGDGPTTAISIRLEKFDGLQCVQALAKSVGKDWWRDGTTVKIGDRGSSKGAYTFSDIDGGKQFKPIRNKIIMTGRDLEGAFMTVICEDSASQKEHGVRELPVDEKNAGNLATLTLIGNKILADLKDPIRPMKGSTDIVTWLGRTVGDSITLNEPRRDAVGSFRAYNVTDKGGIVTVDIGRIIPKEEDLIQEMKSFRTSESIRRALLGEGAQHFGPDSYKDERITQISGESEDGWYIYEGNPPFNNYEITKDYIMLETLAGITTGDVNIRQSRKIGRMEKNASIQCDVEWTCNDITPYTKFAGRICMVRTAITEYFGFRFRGPIIEGNAANTGQGIQVIQLTNSYSYGTRVRLRADYIYNKRVEFFMDGVYKGQLTAGLPPSGDAYTIFLLLSEILGGGVIGKLTIRSYVENEEW